MKKIGAGHAESMARLGLKELRNAFNPSRESIADSELGLYGTMTPGEISEARREQSPSQSMSLSDLQKDAQHREESRQANQERGDEHGHDRDDGMER